MLKTDDLKAMSPDQLDDELLIMRIEIDQRLVEQQQARLLRERHGDLEAALLAVGDLAHDAVGQRREADPRECGARLVVELAHSGERREHPPARTRHPQEAQHDVVGERVARKEREDLVGARHAAPRALVGAKARDLTDQLFRLRIQKSMGQLEAPAKVRSVRRDLARVRTVLRQKRG